ncbi:MAG TPA: 1,4-beta-xylanase [SAR86 cluster bacterium]|nr:1,4-beta-xylanase [SAR86 cluster bacterium]
MTTWDKNKAASWYKDQEWIVGCNFLPSTAINQLEMFQEDSYDLTTLNKELKWASDLGFNSVRVYLHDLLWHDPDNFLERLDSFLEICNSLSIFPILVLFDDCHRPYPKIGKQPLPVNGVHNSGWKQSPGMSIVHEIHDETISDKEIKRLQNYVVEILTYYKEDQRILMWDIYNEPGQFGVGEKSISLLKLTWEWALSVRPSQPLTACLDGSVGEEIIKTNAINSDIITFHTYEGDKLEETIKRLQKYERPLICTEYMAREFGTTFEFSMPLFKKYKVGCINWGLVAGKSQTHFGWSTILDLHKKKESKDFLEGDGSIPEPEVWFHDILRKNGTPFDKKEVAFIKKITAVKKLQ